MKQSEWMKGLLHAETIGAKAAYENYYRNEYEYESPEFVSGLLDYVSNSILRNKEGVV